MDEGAGGSRTEGPTQVESCYLCGEPMVRVQACRFQCKNCGAILDCEDVSGLPL